MALITCTDCPAAIDLARQVMRDHDPERDEADAGCIECTLGTVPKRLETGLCLYHKAEALLWRVRRDGGRV